ncbi:hypothetical protein [Mycoplasma crocodyli]|uniref:Transmembrane protein n=1 Tax=Mycoplasma crocodyli (strain ATCC 51981 / MP145) TaxID=512564 RepID=D5E513_MYCCM|nr:hypothetical protein [Mycoplasma crocodyli]ADE19650.1 hypothetical protein MCRO_0199 [Mycoplasma crocodyli MP145]
MYQTNEAKYLRLKKIFLSDKTKIFMDFVILIFTTVSFCLMLAFLDISYRKSSDFNSESLALALNINSRIVAILIALTISIIPTGLILLLALLYALIKKSKKMFLKHISLLGYIVLIEHLIVLILFFINFGTSQKLNPNSKLISKVLFVALSSTSIFFSLIYTGYISIMIHFIRNSKRRLSDTANKMDSTLEINYIGDEELENMTVEEIKELIKNSNNKIKKINISLNNIENELNKFNNVLDKKTNKNNSINNG